MTRSELFSFPNPVNETSARGVATGVVLMTVLFLVTGWGWVLAPLTYGFLARVLTGPTLSPLGRLSTQVITPRLHVDHTFCAGPPKRFAQGIGATLSIGAAIAHFGFGATPFALVLVAFITVAATLESVFAFCLGCQLFALLMRAKVIPPDVCEACNDIRLRQPVPA